MTGLEAIVASLFCFLETFPINTSSCRGVISISCMVFFNVPELTIIVLQSVTLYIPIITLGIKLFSSANAYTECLGQPAKILPDVTQLVESVEV